MDIKAYLNGKEELPTDPEELKALIGAARAELSALCKGKQWCMCIPVEPTDSDIAIMLGLSAGLKALEEVEDWREGTRRVMAEECAPDEKHCTCVPDLRREIERLQNLIVEWHFASPDSGYSPETDALEQEAEGSTRSGREMPLDKVQLWN